MSDRKEERDGESGEGNSGSGFGWLGLGVATLVGGFIGALLTILSLPPRSAGPQCNRPGPSTTSNPGTTNERFRNRPLTCEPCGVCLDDIQLVVTLPCGHRFHANCVEKWIQEKGTCPICRMQITPDQVKYSV